MGLQKVPQQGRLKTDLAEMGQVLFYPPTVEGWEGGAAWITSSTLLARYNVAGRLILGAEVDPSRPTLVLPPALGWVPITQTKAVQEADFSATDWAKDANANTAAKAVAVLEDRFLRVPLSDSKRAEVVDFLNSRDWKLESKGAQAASNLRSGERSYRRQTVDASMEHLLRRALHLILCTPEYQIH
jgi:hypothetical protein